MTEVFILKLFMKRISWVDLYQIGSNPNGYTQSAVLSAYTAQTNVSLTGTPAEFLTEFGSTPSVV